jgi:hypothetical protein
VSCMAPYPTRFTVWDPSLYVPALLTGVMGALLYSVTCNVQRIGACDNRV